MTKFMRFLYLTSSLFLAICGGTVLVIPDVLVPTAIFGRFLLVVGTGASACFIVYGEEK